MFKRCKYCNERVDIDVYSYFNGYCDEECEYMDIHTKREVGRI